MSDDEEDLSDYLKLRLERIKRNQARLIMLGLDKPYSETVPKTVKRQTKTKKRSAELGNQRRSARLRRKTDSHDGHKAVDEEHVMLSYDSDEFIEDESKAAPRSRRLQLIDFAISHKELKVLEKNIDENYLQKFNVSIFSFRFPVR